MNNSKTICFFMNRYLYRALGCCVFAAFAAFGLNSYASLSFLSVERYFLVSLYLFYCSSLLLSRSNDNLVEVVFLLLLMPLYQTLLYVDLGIGGTCWKVCPIVILTAVCLRYVQIESINYYITILISISIALLSLMSAENLTFGNVFHIYNALCIPALIGSVLSKRNFREQVIDGLFWGGNLLALGSLLLLFMEVMIRGGGFIGLQFHNIPNAFGVLVLINAVYCFYFPDHECKNLIGILTCFLLALMSFSRTALVLGIFIFVFFAIIKKNIRLFGIGMGITVIVSLLPNFLYDWGRKFNINLVSVSDLSSIKAVGLTPRFDLWSNLLVSEAKFITGNQSASEISKFLFGNGIGISTFLTDTASYTSAHNILLTAFFERGVFVGIMVFLSLVWIGKKIVTFWYVEKDKSFVLPIVYYVSFLFYANLTGASLYRVTLTIDDPTITLLLVCLFLILIRDSYFGDQRILSESKI